MDEKVGRNPNHKCICKDTHPGLGPHRDCKVRDFHLCGCGKRATLEQPDVWITTASSILADEAARRDAGKNRKPHSEPLLDEIIARFMEAMLESPLDKVIRQLNEIPQQCAISHHFHAHHFSKRGLIHLCLKKEAGEEEECAKLCAKVILALELDSMDLIHVGGGVPAFHSSHVIAEHDVLGGFHIDPARRN